jgi:hypothetical protein
VASQGDDATENPGRALGHEVPPGLAAQENPGSGQGAQGKGNAFGRADTQPGTAGSNPGANQRDGSVAGDDEDGAGDPVADVDVTRTGARSTGSESSSASGLGEEGASESLPLWETGRSHPSAPPTVVDRASSESVRAGSLGLLGSGVTLRPPVQLVIRSRSQPDEWLSGSSSSPSSLNDWAQSEEGLLGLVADLLTTRSGSEGRDGTIKVQIVNQAGLQVGKSPNGASDVSNSETAPDERISIAGRRSTRLRTERSTEAVELQAGPAYSMEALLRDLENLRDQLQSTGEYAIGWLFDQEISRWLLLGIVVAVTLETARRELRHSRADRPLIDAQGTTVPWME